jgi:Mn2+ and Fe2+ transporters of the NRAMP family
MQAFSELSIFPFMSSRSALLGAAFLMATSAIGPGFITQTTVFTQQLLTSFGFVILISIILDIAAQMNIWRIVAVTEMRAQDISNHLLPGMGYLLAALVVLGGLAFNIGNLAGAGLGINILFGFDKDGAQPVIGAAISAVIALIIFWVKEAGVAMDWFTRILGFVMIGLTIYVATSSNPPVWKAMHHTFIPEKIDVIAIITLVGGTVGGYISFSGAHRLLDAGIKGRQALPRVTRSSVTAILLASLMRVLLFLAALGVVVSGAVLSNDNPPASVFSIAAGAAGLKIFGVVLWAAAITSVVGSAYTSISFFRTFHPFLNKHHRIPTTIFILISAVFFISAGIAPKKLLIAAGTLNGFTLPIALALLLLAARNKCIAKDYQHPVWLTIIGWFVVIVIGIMAGKVLSDNIGG